MNFDEAARRNSNHIEVSRPLYFLLDQYLTLSTNRFVIISLKASPFASNNFFSHF